MRRVVPILAAAALAAVTAAPAAAAPDPEPTFDVPPVIPMPPESKLGPDGVWRFTLEPPDFTTDPTRDPCGVRAEIDMTGTGVLKTFRSGRQRIFFPHGLMQRATNTANGRTVTLDISGPLSFFPEADGDYAIGFYGRNIFAIENAQHAKVSGLPVGAYHMERGSAVYWFDVEGEGASRTETLVKFRLRTPRIQNVCDLLR